MQHRAMALVAPLLLGIAGLSAPPGAEFARAGVAPLEAAFLDAATVKRTFAARNGRVPGAY